MYDRQKGRSVMKKYLRYIAAFGTALLVSLAGIAWQMLFPSYEVLGVFAGLAVG